ncbi:DUF1304 domain-containing protein [Bacillus cereus]|uniref:DUF1304 domain-containing protein n=1 Tax=Bacillus cereus TaxID=1396 RepID=UPI0018F601A3|nr:DUF1304 domain-containing protein [Bacillus cereus]MBJ8026070.1 DUF1304 domain-containing protein [Bacillus cereus]MBJ8038354.1 DUF1304 domain-containing protein [Bacillus cereus]
MHILAMIFTTLVALEHIYIMILEIFFSTSTVAQKTFGISKKELNNPHIKNLFANQGLYNGFLAAGLFWGLFFMTSPYDIMIQLFFLTCIIIAAIYGAFTVHIGILLKQGVPAMFAFLCLIGSM